MRTVPSGLWGVYRVYQCVVSQRLEEMEARVSCLPSLSQWVPTPRNSRASRPPPAPRSPVRSLARAVSAWLEPGTGSFERRPAEPRGGGGQIPVAPGAAHGSFGGRWAQTEIPEICPKAPYSSDNTHTHTPKLEPTPKGGVTLSTVLRTKSKVHIMPLLLGAEWLHGVLPEGVVRRTALRPPGHANLKGVI